MNLSYIIFLFIWIIIGWIIVYLWAHFTYDNKKKVDKCFKERKEYSEKNQILENKVKELEENIKELNKEIEHSKREIAEKNKYLSEDKVVIERLAQIKELSNKISDILLDYDKETIHHLLQEYKRQEDEVCYKDDDKASKKIWW